MEKHFSTIKIHNHQHYHTIMYYYIFKSSNLNSKTLNFFENFDGKYFLYALFYLCIKFHEKNH
jgi:hypothetical protein